MLAGGALDALKRRGKRDEFQLLRCAGTRNGTQLYLDNFGE